MHSGYIPTADKPPARAAWASVTACGFQCLSLIGGFGLFLDLDVRAAGLAPPFRLLVADVLGRLDIGTSAFA